MKKAFIWDLDGTLLDSYALIVPCLRQTFREMGLDMASKEIRDMVLRDSVTALMELGSEKTGLPFDTLMGRYKEISEARLMEIPLLPGAKDLLAWLKEQGMENHVYTHRGASSEPVLKHLGIRDYFGEVITSLNGFPRKPDPAGLVYLQKKLGYPMDALCYVGDRRLDMECALNGGMDCVLLLTPESPITPTGRETAVISALMDLPLLLEQGIL